MSCNQANPIKKMKVPHIQIRIHALAQSHNYATWELWKNTQASRRHRALLIKETKIPRLSSPSSSLFEFHLLQRNHYSQKVPGQPHFFFFFFCMQSHKSILGLACQLTRHRSSLTGMKALGCIFWGQIFTLSRNFLFRLTLVLSKAKTFFYNSSHMYSSVTTWC